MADAAQELDAIDRIHDDEPQQAAARLRALDVAALPPGRAPLAAFLFNHVLGEKLGAWNDAADHIDALRRQLADAPAAVLVHAAVADELAGRNPSDARAALAAASPAAAVECAVALRRLAFTQEQRDTQSFALALRDLARRAAPLAAGDALDAQLAAGLNNATSRLLDLNPDVTDALTREALQTGAVQALRFWHAAGTWVNHERALYLVALVGNRIGAPAQARAAARQALEVIAANGTEDIDRAFLLLQLAGAQQRLGEEPESRAARDAARAIAAAWSDAGLAQWFAGEEARLFAPATEGKPC